MTTSKSALDVDADDLKNAVERNTQAVHLFSVLLIVGLIIAAIITGVALKQFDKSPADDQITASITRWLEQEKNQKFLSNTARAEFENLSASNDQVVREFKKLQEDFETLQKESEKQAALMQLQYSGNFLSAVRAEFLGEDLEEVSPLISADYKLPEGTERKAKQDGNSDSLSQPINKLHKLIAPENAKLSVTNPKPIQLALDSIRAALTDKSRLQSASISDLQDKKQTLTDLKNLLAFCYVKIQQSAAPDQSPFVKDILLLQTIHLIGLVEQTNLSLEFLIPEVELDATSVGKAKEVQERLRKLEATPIVFGSEEGGVGGPVYLWWFEKKGSNQNVEKGFYVAMNETNFIPIKIVIDTRVEQDDWWQYHRVCKQDRTTSGNIPTPIRGGVMLEFSKPGSFYKFPGIFLTYLKKEQDGTLLTDMNGNPVFDHFALVGEARSNAKNKFKGSNWDVDGVSYRLTQIWKCDDRGRLDRSKHRQVYPPPTTNQAAK